MSVVGPVQRQARAEHGVGLCRLNIADGPFEPFGFGTQAANSCRVQAVPSIIIVLSTGDSRRQASSMNFTELPNNASELRFLAANHDDVGQLQSE